MLLTGLVTCHDLSKFADDDHPSTTSTQSTIQSLTGPTLDRKMFESTGWHYQNREPFPIVTDHRGTRYELVRRYATIPATKPLHALVCLRPPGLCISLVLTRFI